MRYVAGVGYQTAGRDESSERSPNVLSALKATGLSASTIADGRTLNHD